MVICIPSRIQFSINSGNGMALNRWQAITQTNDGQELLMLYGLARPQCINPLRAKFFRGNINIYLHFVSFLHIDTTQVAEILPQTRQEPTYST